jgi:hypothetical protein
LLDQINVITSVSQSQPCCLEPKQAVAAIPEELRAQTRIATMPVQLTYANLNSLLCPAITDPFYGKNYRSYGIVHQFFITLVFGCVSNFIGNEEKIMLD